MTTLFLRDGTEAKANGATKTGAPTLTRDQTCSRCGGQGGADKWKPTGWTCFRCGGNGKDPNKAVLKLYTQEKLEKLNIAADKRAEKARIVREENEKIEAARQEAERATVLAANAPLLARIKKLVPERKEGSFFASIIEQIEVKARNLSDRQTEVVEASLAKIEAENARLAAAAHVGVVGSRCEMTLTLKKIVSWGDQYTTGITYLMIMQNENGSKVLYKGQSPHSLGFKTKYDPEMRASYIPLDQTVTVIASVKEHTLSKFNGEPETLIQRPKVVETA